MGNDSRNCVAGGCPNMIWCEFVLYYGTDKIIYQELMGTVMAIGLVLEFPGQPVYGMDVRKP